jgi:hypothetical protein
MSEDSKQDSENSGQKGRGPPRRPKAPSAREGRFSLGPLGNLNQVIKALGKTIRSMASGELNSQDGARICNGLGIMRACLETAALERIESRLNQLEGTTPTYGNSERDRPSYTAH